MIMADRIAACIARHPDWNDKRVAKAIACRMHEVEAVRAGNPASEPEPRSTPKAVGIVTLDTVREKLDIRAAIHRETLRIRPGQLVEEREMRARTAGNDAARFRRAVENHEDEFAPFRLKLRLTDGEARWWWGRADTVAEAAKIRDM